jgi:CO/xanthine dehydrogenase FAD-binding subunit
LLLSKALLALGQSALLAGDAAAATASAAEAQQRFAAGKQHESEWRALLIEAQASEKLGDKARAQELARQASNILREIESQWGTEHYKTYILRPDVEDLQRQLEPLK